MQHLQQLFTSRQILLYLLDLRNYALTLIYLQIIVFLFLEQPSMEIIQLIEQLLEVSLLLGKDLLCRH